MTPQTNIGSPWRAWLLPVLAAVLLSGAAWANESVPFDALGGDQCYAFSQLVAHRTEDNRTVARPLELTIDNEAEYRKLFDPALRRQSCGAGDPAAAAPAVDFAKRSVLGLWRTGSCADTGFTRSVMRDDGRKTITFSISTVHGGKPACMGPGPESLNLIAIPKIPAGYTVIFATGE